MIPPIKKNPAFLLAVILSLLLCNTATVFATGSISTPVSSSQSDSEAADGMPSGANPPADYGMEMPIPSAILPMKGDGTEKMPDEMTPPADSILPEDDIVWKNAATVSELMSLLEDEDWMNAGGHIRITDDLVIPADDDCMIRPATSEDMPLVVDLGTHTLYVEGWLRSNGNTKYIGDGGENGLIHIRTGGRANIRSAVFAVTAEDGYAIWQEEGSLLEYSPGGNTVGKVHFAQSPVAMPFSAISPDVALPVAVVHDGQTPEDVLPVTDSVRLYWQGVMDQGTDDTDKLIPIVWNLEPYRERLYAGERVLITGSYPDVVAFETPVCLVVFQNGNPATFLNGHGAQSYGRPVSIVNVELAEPEYGCRFEWSQDGVRWLPAEFTKIPNGDGPLRFKVFFPQEEPPAYPYYLSAVVDYPDGSVGYSDVIIFTETGRECGSGGNRGGGTDITDSSSVPKPDPPDNSDMDDGSEQKPEPPIGPDITPNPVPETPDQPDTTPLPTINPPDPSDTASPREEPENPEETPEPKPTTSPMEEIPVTVQTDPPDPSDTASPREEPENPEEASEPKPTTSPMEEIPVTVQTAPPAPSDTTSPREEPENPEETPEPKPTASPMEENPVTGQTAPPAKAESNLQASSKIVSGTDKEAAIAEAVSLQSGNEGDNLIAKAVPVAAGGISTAAVIGVAGIYHSESLRKRLRSIIKKRIRTKK